MKFTLSVSLLAAALAVPVFTAPVSTEIGARCIHSAGIGCKDVEEVKREPVPSTECLTHNIGCAKPKRAEPEPDCLGNGIGCPDDVVVVARTPEVECLGIGCPKAMIARAPEVSPDCLKNGIGCPESVVERAPAPATECLGNGGIGCPEVKREPEPSTECLRKGIGCP